MGIFKKATHWLFNTPDGLFTFGILYGATVVGLCYKEYSEQKKREERAFEDGMYFGLDLAKEGISDVKMTEISVNGLKKGYFLHKNVDPKPENQADDYGAETGTSCTINENEASEN